MMDSTLISANEYATIVAERETHVLVSRQELEREHRILLARIHRLRQLLNYPPLETGKEKRRERT